MHGRIDADHAIGMIDVGHRPDRLGIEAQKGGNGGAAAFESERRDCDRVFAIVDQRLRENRACQDGALAAPPMNADLVLFLHNLPRNSRNRGRVWFLSVLGRANSLKISPLFRRQRFDLDQNAAPAANCQIVRKRPKRPARVQVGGRSGSRDLSLPRRAVSPRKEHPQSGDHGSGNRRPPAKAVQWSHR